MLGNVGLYSYLAASVAYAVLTLLLAVSWRGRPFGLVLIVASTLTALWAGVVAAGTLAEYPPIKIMQLTEVLRNAGWIFFLLQLTSLRFDGKPYTLGGWRWVPLFLIGLGIVVALLFLSPGYSAYFSTREGLNQDIAFGTWLGMSLLGLLLLEQIFRNASEGERWSIKYLCFGLGGIFAYDFFMYAEALLFRQLNPQMWQARGIVNALAAPLLAIAIARNSSWKLELHVSRQVVFHTVTLLGAGVYLLLMSVAGYFIKFMGGTWGSVLQISFLGAAGILLLTLLFSGKIRATTRVLLSKHFFSYKYDYREEWLKFTQTLAGNDANAPDGIIRAMGSLVNSPAGLLWACNDGGQYTLLSHCQMPAPESATDMTGLAVWLQQSQWVIDIDELQRDPDLYSGLTPPRWLGAIPHAWLVIPLIFGEKLQGILLLRHSELQQTINWEDRDLLKTAGRQAASHLAQHLASQELVEARQFEAFNRLSAYVVHDLKNILAQQSLMVSNAQKHKHNPAFVDDMIATVENSVSRMTNLMDQMRSGIRGTEPQPVHIAELLEEVVTAREITAPKPHLKLGQEACIIQSDRDRLGVVFNHLIQNAQEASDDKNGWVEIRLGSEGNCAVVEIEDNGIGMDTGFVRSRLFKPFDSTKGLTGMGIGAFESREFIRGLGGDIRVESTAGQGSLFRVTIPCLQDEYSE